MCVMLSFIMVFILKVLLWLSRHTVRPDTCMHTHMHAQVSADANQAQYPISPALVIHARESNYRLSLLVKKIQISIIESRWCGSERVWVGRRVWGGHTLQDICT